MICIENVQKVWNANNSIIYVKYLIIDYNYLFVINYLLYSINIIQTIDNIYNIRMYY